jgi:hypothetical protein
MREWTRPHAHSAIAPKHLCQRPQLMMPLLACARGEGGCVRLWQGWESWQGTCAVRGCSQDRSTPLSWWQWQQQAGSELVRREKDAGKQQALNRPKQHQGGRNSETDTHLMANSCSYGPALLLGLKVPGMAFGRAGSTDCRLFTDLAESASRCPSSVQASDTCKPKHRNRGWTGKPNLLHCLRSWRTHCGARQAHRGAGSRQSWSRQQRG